MKFSFSLLEKKYPVRFFRDNIVNDKLSVQIFTNQSIDFARKSTFNITAEFILSTNKKINLTGLVRVLSEQKNILYRGYHLFGKRLLYNFTHIR